MDKRRNYFLRELERLSQMVNVMKFDGSKQPFDKTKVYNTCMRMNATPQQARDVAGKVAAKVYEGIPTKKVLQLIFTFLKEHRPEVQHRIDLREAISLMRSKPDFERFVQLLLQAEGYDVEPNQIISGRCVEHEIDAVAKKRNGNGNESGKEKGSGKNGETVYVEVKHHIQSHTFTGVGVFLEARATYEDLNEGFKNKKNNYDFTRVLVITNTKMSEHALRYADCRNISHIGWRDPYERGLEEIVMQHGFYPVTLLKGISENFVARLGDAGIVLLKQLVEGDLEKISRETRIPRNFLQQMANKASEIMKR